MERRTVLRGALALPVAAAVLVTFGPGQATPPVASPAGPAATPTRHPAGRRYRSWDVETLDRRLRVARS